MRLLAAVLTCAVLATACAASKPFARVTTQVEAIGGGWPQGLRVHVWRDPSAPADLLRSEVAGKLDYLLGRQGYAVVAAPELADLVVLFRYGAGQHSEATTTQVYDPAVPATQPAPGSGFWGGFAAGMATSTSRMRPQQTVVTINDRYLFMDVMDVRPVRGGGQVQLLWQVRATSAGKSSDLRLVLNYMLVAAMGYFGHDTGQAKTVNLRGDDPVAATLASLRVLEQR